MFTQMTFSEMAKRAEEGTLKYVMIKEYSVGFGTRFKVYDILDDIKTGVDNLILAKKLKNVKYIHISELWEDRLFLGIKFKDDKTKHKYSIEVKTFELMKKYRIIDYRKNGYKNPGLIGGILEIVGRKGLERKLVNIILDAE